MDGVSSVEMIAFIVATVTVLVILGGASVSYVLYAIGVGTMAEREGVSGSWLAWIPIAQWYVVAEIVREKAIIRSGAHFLTYTFVSIIMGCVLFVVGELASGQVSVLCTIFGYILTYGGVAYIWVLHYLLLARYTKHALLLILLGCFVFDIIISIGLFRVRNNPIRGVVTQEEVGDDQKSIDLEE